jgi:hypothetical protein
MWEPPSAFVTFCGNRLTSFFGGFASPICRLRMADGGSDQGFGTRGPSWDGWRGLRSGLWHSWAVLGWLAGAQIRALALVGRPGMAGGGSDRALAIVCRPATADAGRAVLRRRTCRRAHPAPLRAPLTSPADA